LRCGHLPKNDEVSIDASNRALAIWQQSIPDGNRVYQE
jgi:hypothetical protein